MNLANYQIQLLIGRKYEEEAQEIIKTLFKTEIIEIQTDENYKDVLYDFKTSDGTTYEIKADLLSNKTGNFFIEFQNSNYYTGITTTKAKYHIITNGTIYYLIKTRKIKQLILFNQYRTGMTEDGSIGYLIPTSHIIEKSEILKIMDLK